MSPKTSPGLSPDWAFNQSAARGLVWLPALGMGYLPAPTLVPYDDAYFEKYVQYAGTDLGRRLTAARLDFSAEAGQLVDIGIGSGQFVAARLEAGGWVRGFDVCPRAVQWLEQRNLLLSPYEDGPVEAVSLWDVLEHIPDPARLLAQVSRWVFISLPIFADMEEALASKHYRPGEHLWYWTHDGLVRWMALQGFRFVRDSLIESQLGRDGITSFAFRR